MQVGVLLNCAADLAFTSKCIQISNKRVILFL